MDSCHGNVSLDDTMSLRESSTFAFAAADELLTLHNWYQRYHGYLASVVCVFGIIANTLNIIVLTRPNMISSTNCILTGLAVSYTGLAVSDTGLAVSYTGLAVSYTGLAVSGTGLAVSYTGLAVSDTGLAVSNTGLAVSDGLTMAAYLPFALRFYVLYGLDFNPERNSYAAINYMLFFACFSVVVHSISIWLTVTLAVFRYPSLITCMLSS